MDVGPFSRKQWASQSLRITAKELSLVGNRGKKNAITERFSKYQKAAEEASAENKKSLGWTSSYKFLACCTSGRALSLMSSAQGARRKQNREKT
uniref:Uncharacterized protein n=1 Tax=Sinocyclocheilus grahami TaxID=75366 RepID=A0A672JZU5_SINGR